MNEGNAPFSLGVLGASEWKRNIALHLPVAGGARPWICRGFERPLLVVLPNSRFVRDFSGDADSMRGFAELPAIHSLPEIAIASYSDDPHMLEAQKAARGEALGRWADSGGIMLATPGALMGPVSLGGDRLALAAGPGASRSRLIEWLASHGYERTDIVWSPGQFTYRGGIIDFFDPASSNPARVEFFDDDIESMRYFATDTQRSVRNVSKMEVRALSSRRDSSALDFFPNDMHAVFVEPSELENAADNYSWLRRAVGEDGECLASSDWPDIERACADYPRVRVTAGVERAERKSGIMGLPNFRGRRRDLEAYCSDMESRGVAVVLVSEVEHFRKWGDERGYRTLAGGVSEGFCDTFGGTLLIGDLEMSGLAVGGRAAEARVPLDWGDRLMPGQWVVHEDYGVARFLGAEQIEGPDGTQEYLVLEYAEERKLKIPVMHFNRISPYRTYPGTEPVADSLRGGQWKKMSRRAREQAEIAARYLLDVYAKRETARGRAFAGNQALESEFEAAFPWKETADQLRAIDEVSRDMARPVPMDRLLVGDVGFGKTEVALRAAAKCVFEGCQVALIAPTTLLAEQHHATWSARFDPFGVRVEGMSRFVAQSKQKKILEDAASGRIDVLIGTHRMFGADVKFKDLGLVIVDEEHKFGVMHKEHLKNLYPEVDVLMLSATPIPRSLHMSLSGLRDMSLIETPPRKRMPVITASGMWRESLVKNAVMREHARGGQVFYVHNRVSGIDREAMTVRRLFPKMRVGVAHGRMQEKVLKETMDSFANAELDILVCTTIVESGLDMPRANTLIVSDSQDLGLAQMHQLRGRVGRREDQAYALFLYPEGAILTKEAMERMEAIAALGEFGAGYELARRDLEIRGGGELVGVAQHGNLGRVGFQRYCDLLEEAIRRVRGDFRESTQVEVSIPSAIPGNYLPHESLRVALYRKLLWTREECVLDALREEAVDRFGPMPRVLEFLFDVARIRILGPDCGIAKVFCGASETSVQLAPGAAMASCAPPAGWFRREHGFIGPGGMESLRRLVSHAARLRA
ncbi:MAG: DEAD/DEAH box helicase [Synergistaceae bacterium]|jgi:transcription-repair coupling factor (superfamily II helicase)|nr:DEAD/DEAH box helicase [Synergistaceae bacterium]